MPDYDPFDDNSSNDDADFQPHEWHDGQSTQKSGMSSTMKIILLVVGLVGICFLLCCGTIGYFTYNMIPKIVQTPAEVKAVSEEIATVDIHPDLEPQMGMDMGVQSIMKMKMAVYTSNDASAFFSMQQMELKTGGNAQGNMDFNDEMEGSTIDIENKESEIKKITIDGTEYEFTIVRGTAKGTSDKAFTISGNVDQSTGSDNKTLGINISSKSKTFDEAAAIKMIETIKPK